METSFDQEIWRQIPPEEKFELMARAQAKGFIACAITIVTCCTIAVGLKQVWLMWASFLLSPFIFQLAAGKEWRDLKPRVLLFYLAARSASRRYAFNVRSTDLTPKFLFRGKVERVFDQSHLQEALDAMVNQTKEAQVWVSLFSDAVVMISERPGGAELCFAHLLDDKVSIEGRSPSGRGEYASDREVYFTVREKVGGDVQEKTIKVTSKHPAALLVFEKKVKEFQTLRALGPKALTSTASNAGSSEDDDKFNNLFSFND